MNNEDGSKGCLIMDNRFFVLSLVLVFVVSFFSIVFTGGL
jgi:hypothetical protein